MIVKPIDVPDVPISTVLAANEFGFDLFRRMYAGYPNENWVTSPASLWFMLSMAIGGAAGETLKEMRRTMALHDDYSLVDLGRLRQIEEPLRADGTVRIANLLAVHDQYTLLPTFETYCRDVMGSETMRRSFADPATAAAINAWVAQITQGKINNILQGLSPADRIVLVNAIYLKAQWVKKFMDAEPDWFEGPAGRTTCMMMSKKERMRYAKHDGWRAVKIPYQGDRLSMLIVLPDQGVPLTQLISSLEITDLEQAMTSSLSMEVNLEMPRFKIEGTMEANLMAALQAMGMQSAFNPGAADFTPMSGKRDLFVGKVMQKAVIEVDEVGTEAAAATMMTFALSMSAKEESTSLRLDRPFFYCIVDEQTNLVLFNGVVNKPTEG